VDLEVISSQALTHLDATEDQPVLGGENRQRQPIIADLALRNTQTRGLEAVLRLWTGHQCTENALDRQRPLAHRAVACKAILA
jgi:hypothetical protein